MRHTSDMRNGILNYVSCDNEGAKHEALVFDGCFHITDRARK